jgi:hypothetical protein
VQLAHALLTARGAIQGSAPASPEWSQTDVLLGTATGSEAADRDFLKGVEDRGSGFGSPSTFVYTLATAAPAEVALALGLRGTLATLTAGSISGLTALVSAANHVGKGRSRACIAGGVELPGTRLGLGDAEGELAALFLLEPSATAGHWPSITGAELGFDPERPSNLGEPFASATTTLLRMASACADPRAATPIEISGRSPEGHWARFHLQW